MINLSRQDALDLPVDELALYVLADLLIQNARSEYNYVLTYRNDSNSGFSRNASAQQAIAEALGWLRARGLIARPPADTMVAAIFVTRRGRKLLETQNMNTIRAVDRLQENVHPLIQRKARRQFLLGEYENAIFVSMKAVEVRVRALAGFGDEVIGVHLMTRAFKSGGPLADHTAPPGEVEGTMMLFRGAYAVLRNPSGHREETFD